MIREALAVVFIDLPLFVIGNALDLLGYDGLEDD